MSPLESPSTTCLWSRGGPTGSRSLPTSCCIRGRRSASESRPAGRVSPICRITSRRSPASRGGRLDWISGGALAAGADFLLHDAQYLDEEYEPRSAGDTRASTDAVAFSRAVDARQLVLFHHDPERSDSALELLETRARELTGGEQLPPVLAREGMVIELS